MSLTPRQLEARKYYAMRPRLTVREICKRMGGISRQGFYQLLKCSTRDRLGVSQRKLERHLKTIRKLRPTTSIQRLAEHYKVAEQTMQIFLEEHGLATLDYDLRRHDDEMRHAVVAARKAGMTYREIRERWGVHPPTTNRWMKEDTGR